MELWWFAVVVYGGITVVCNRFRGGLWGCEMGLGGLWGGLQGCGLGLGGWLAVGVIFGGFRWFWV